MATPVSDGDAAVGRYRAAQARIAVALLRDVRRLRRLITASRLTASVPTWIEAMQTVIEQYGHGSAALAAEVYDAQRAAAGVTGRFTVPVADTAPEEQITESLRWATKDLWPRDPDDPGTTVAQKAPLSVRLDAAESKAEQVAQRLAAEPGRSTMRAAVRQDRQAVAYARAAALGGCSFCKLMASRGAVYKDAGTAGRDADELFSGDASVVKFHNNCVPAGTLVDGPAAEVGYRRWYEGEMLVVGTAAGHELSITPNHPVLTDRGWVPAGLLSPGDHVLSSLNAQGSLLSIPDEEHVPALAEDVWGPLSVLGLVGVPVSTEDFHGDGTEGEVNVVGADGLLRNHLESNCIKVGAEQVFSRAGMGEGLLTADCATHQFVRAGLTSSNGRMGSFGVGRSLGRGELLHPVGQRRTGAPHRHSGLLEPQPDDVATHAVTLGEGELALPFDVGRDDLRVGEVFPSSGRFDPTGLYVSAEGAGSYARLGRALGERLAGRVERDRVLYVRRVEFAGHVYNFQTSEGWYRAAGIIVSNCHCTIVPVFRGQRFTLSPAAAEWDQIYQQYAAGHPGRQLALFRRALRDHGTHPLPEAH